MKGKFDASDVFKTDTAENLARINELVIIWEEQVRCMSEICDANEDISLNLAPADGSGIVSKTNRGGDLSEFYGRLDRIKVSRVSCLGTHSIEITRIWWVRASVVGIKEMRWIWNNVFVRSP